MFSHLERAAPKPSIATDDEAQPPDSVRRRQLTVQILLPPASGKTPQPASWLLTYLFPNDSLIVGRTPQRADVAIPGDPELSGAHMQFSLSESSCRVTDLGSSNGSWLNGLRFTDELLQHGDGIHAGRTYVLVHLDSGKAATLRKPLATVDVADSRRKRQQQKLRTRGFQIINKTPFRFAPLTGRMGYPRHSLTLIVKGTFEFCPGKPMTFAEEQLFPMPEEPYLDTEDPAAPPRYENDFAFDKPKADILLAGHCHAPRGKPVDKLTAEVRVGEWSRSLDVCGRRSWQFVRGHWKQSSPEPFTSLELRYEHSYGGPGFDENPFGVGYIDKKELRSGGPVPIPQIVAPGDVPKSPDESSVAVGFGPLAKYAGRRRKQLGTYDELWEQRYWPWFPPDFSWDHFNAAPEEQQLHEPLRGDEKIELKNLNAKNPLYKTALPGIRVRCFVNPIGRMFFEVPMSADTLWLDVDAEQAVLVWRGNLQVESEECGDLRHIFVLSQPLDEEPLSLNECHARLLNELNKREAQFRPPPEAAPGDDTPRDAEVSSSDAADTAADEEEKAFEAEMARLQAEIRSAQIAGGADPELFDKQVQAEVERLTKLWELEGDLPPAMLDFRIQKELWDVLKRVHDAQVAAGHEPDPLPPEPQPPEDTAESSVDTSGKWTRERVEAHHAAGGSFAGELLSGLDLSGLTLAGADFQSAVLSNTRLTGTDLSGCNLTLANLSGADLTQARLTKSVLKHADFSTAILHGATLDEVDASGTIFATAWLTRTSMENARAGQANFSSADLTGADLSSSLLDGADFSHATLIRCRFVRASMVEAKLGFATAREACFDHAQLDRVRATECNLLVASLRQISAPNSIWEKALLNFADLSYSHMPGANLIQANLKDATLTASDLSAARLSKAVMRRAVMTDAKLLEADLQQADLRGGDISRSCLFGAEVHGALWDKCTRESVNWKMSKSPAEDDG